MSLALARRLSCRHEGSAGLAIKHWLSTHAHAPVAAERLGQAWLIAFGYADGWGGCVGLGLHGPETAERFDALQQFFAHHGLDPSIIVNPYAHESVTSGLAERGYRFTAFRQVLVRAPGRLPGTAPQVSIGIGQAPDVLARGFCEGAEPGPGHRLIESVFDTSPGSNTLIATVGGHVVGGGRIAMAEGFALLYGSSVLPAFRRRGIHLALLRARMNMALERGCDTVAIECAPGSATERNAMRLGFSVAFTQGIFRRL